MVLISTVNMTPQINLPSMVIMIICLLTCTTSASADAQYFKYYGRSILAGPNSTSTVITEGPNTTIGTAFGITTVFDEPLTKDGDPNSPVVGRSQGFHMGTSRVILPEGVGLLVVLNLIIPSSGCLTAIGLGAGKQKLEAGRLLVVGGTGDYHGATGEVNVLNLGPGPRTGVDVVFYSVILTTGKITKPTDDKPMKII